MYNVTNVSIILISLLQPNYNRKKLRVWKRNYNRKISSTFFLVADYAYVSPKQAEGQM